MGLREYIRKRHFDDTPEPEGKLKKAKSRRLEFVVQKHRASQLHYDFRLELDGVLKSWAVPKGPSPNPKDKRLAMMVEDHPFEYRKFEGVIPEGNYGAGNVIIWDKGWYELHREEESWPATLQEGLKKGDLKFILHGEKLKGSFALIKTPHMGENAWLLIKHKDKYAADKDITKEDKSVVSGKTVEEIGNNSPEKLDDFPKAPMPKDVRPMLATLVDEAFDDPDWLFEIKWDGYRALAGWDGKQAELYSRNGLDFSKKYPAVYESLRDIKHQLVIDGEIVALDESGKSRFEWLQNYTRELKGQLAYFVFDILWCDGHDLGDAPLNMRKSILKSVLPKDSLIQYSDHVGGKGKEFFASAAAHQLEGIIAKKADSAYKRGYRSKQWLKIKTHLRQEAVIGGWTEPRGSRKYIGALVLGVYDQGELYYIGHTGGGIPPSQMKDLHQRLEKLERRDSPFVNKFKPNAPVHWVEPKIVCEVSFTEWTDDGHMRHPIFVGLRPDKSPSDVRREMPKDIKTKSKTKFPKQPERDDNPDKLELTHLDKIFFSKAGYTKGDLVDYYKTVAKLMLPYLKDRPHSLLRQPNGIDGESFFQKDVDHMPPDWVQTVEIYSESNDKNINYLVCNSSDTLLYMVQLGCIEINPWNSTVKHLDKPDWMVIDLDPEDIGFNKVIETAKMVHKVCDELGIPSYPKTSGKTGIHIYIPLAAKYDYEQVKQFAEIIANLVNQRLPKITSILRMPAKRKKKVYVDFLQNRKGQTLAAPYSIRPTAEATVSTPLNWDEVNSRLDPSNFTIKNIHKRLDKVGDLWKPVLGKGIDIKKILASL